jgi:two-component system, sensor histidine kinase RegB
MSETRETSSYESEPFRLISSMELQTHRYGALRKLFYLRWLVLVFFTALLVGCLTLTETQLPSSALGLSLAFMGINNLIGATLFKRAHITQAKIGLSLIADVIILSVLLSYSGGPANPFSVLYLILVMLAAMMTNTLWTWLTVLSSSICYALIFWFYHPLPPTLGGGHGHAHQASSFSLHLQGMWLAYTIAAIAIGLFVSKLSEDLQREREQRLEGEKLLGLAALAAGAAHEVGNPLGTIRVVTSDLEAQLRERGESEELLQDLTLINDEIERASRVLRRLSSSAGELTGESISPLEAATFFTDLERREELVGEVKLSIDPQLSMLTWPFEATSQALIQLIRNAHQASPIESEVWLSAVLQDAGVQIEIQDRGCGMSRETLSRYGDPFFTTREGVGMGLGVFMSRSLIERLGGKLMVDSRQGVGTTVTVWLPLQMV